VCIISRFVLFLQQEMIMYMYLFYFFSRARSEFYSPTLRILITDAFPILCNATIASPFSQYPATFAYDTAADNISSVVSVSVARAEPSAKSGIKPLVSCACFAGVSPEHVHVKESVVSVGTKTVNTGTFGLYFATSLAVLPPCVKTTIKAARTFCAVRTADEAKDSNGIIGFSTCAKIALNKT